jgi:hypothetical protein
MEIASLTWCLETTPLQIRRPLVTTEDNSHYKALAEDFDTRTKVLAEGHVGLKQQLDRLEARVAPLEERCARLEIRADVQGKDVSQLESTASTLESRVDLHEDRLDHLEARRGPARDGA